MEPEQPGGERVRRAGDVARDQQTQASQAGFSDVEVLDIDHDVVRFYRLV